MLKKLTPPSPVCIQGGVAQPAMMPKEREIFVEQAGEAVGRDGHRRRRNDPRRAQKAEELSKGGTHRSRPG